MPSSKQSWEQCPEKLEVDDRVTLYCQLERGHKGFCLVVMEKVRGMLAAIDTPEVEDFLGGVKREAAHQVKRWGYAHDRSKSAENWFWLVGYLAGKALRAAISGDKKKAQHHTISSAAALYNWHTAIKHDTTGAGVGQDEDLRRANPIDSQAMEAAGDGGHTA